VTPRVSVVVPSWEMGRFLRAALESLRAQTFRDLEVLVHDNGSDDETPAVLHEYRDLVDCRIEPDDGQSDALRRGFARSRGEILCWLNADDLLMPDALERAVAAFDAPERPDVVYGDCALLDREGQFLRYFHEIQPFDAGLLCNRSNFIAQSSAFFRRDAYERVGGIDGTLEFAMDWDLWCRLARAACRFHRIDAVLSGARHYASTKTASGGISRLHEIAAVNRRYMDTRLPLVAAAHLYGDALQTLGLRLPALDRLARRWWRRSGTSGATISGVASDARVAPPGFGLRFPLHRAVEGATLRLEAPSSARDALVHGLKAEFDGEAGLVEADEEPRKIRIRWRFEPSRELAAADISVSLAEAWPAGTPGEHADEAIRFVGLRLELATGAGS